MNTTKMKQLAFGATSVALTLPVAAFAQIQGGLDKTAGSGSTSGLQNTTISSVIANLITWGLYIIGGLGVLGFVYSGFLYITAAGDDTKTGEAKKVMVYSVVGVLVALIGLIAMKTVIGVVGANNQNY